MNYKQATEALHGFWDDWQQARLATEMARQAYHEAARGMSIRTCSRCAKPMPDGDYSSQCDGCNLDWGWDTPQGRRDRRAEQLDAEIARLRAEREKL